METLAEKTWKELRGLTISTAFWNLWGNEKYAIFKLNDGQFCQINYQDDISKFEPNFDQTKKITKIDSVMRFDDYRIIQMNFYHQQQKLFSLGMYDDYYESEGGAGRVEVFEIADDEQLIGC